MNSNTSKPVVFNQTSNERIAIFPESIISWEEGSSYTGAKWCTISYLAGTEVVKISVKESFDEIKIMLS